MLGLFFAMTLLSAMQSQPADSRPIDSGVSQALARERASAIQDLHYDLTFSIPGSRKYLLCLNQTPCKTERAAPLPG